ncbi:MAG: hypothetical protein L3J04_11125 [Robiginitomaculum sp.]|nr:hypothetical protein [Robiginitomaculum sp.]
MPNTLAKVLFVVMVCLGVLLTLGLGLLIFVIVFSLIVGVALTLSSLVISGFLIPEGQSGLNSFAVLNVAGILLLLALVLYSWVFAWRTSHKFFSLPVRWLFRQIIGQ